MGQIKNIKLHIVTDIKTCHVTSQPTQCRRKIGEWLAKPKGSNLLKQHQGKTSNYLASGILMTYKLVISHLRITLLSKRRMRYIYHTQPPDTPRKAQCPIVERLVNAMMMHGRNNGKKLLAVRIARHAFEIIHLLTGENPLQVLVDAITNSAPREDSTRIGRAGTVRRQAVDVAPLRRVNQAIW